MTPVVRVKDGVRFDRIAPAGFRILASLDMATYRFGRDVTITSGTDSHPPDDPHTLGCAYDIRTSDLALDQVSELWDWLTRTLGSAFTVIMESPQSNPSATAVHIHIQKRKGTAFP